MDCEVEVILHAIGDGERVEPGVAPLVVVWVLDPEGGLDIVDVNRGLEGAYRTEKFHLIDEHEGER